jgi:hypothetical protein
LIRTGASAALGATGRKPAASRAFTEFRTKESKHKERDDANRTTALVKMSLDQAAQQLAAFCLYQRLQLTVAHALGVRVCEPSGQVLKTR